MKILTERRDIAKALNFGKYPVLSYNVDTKEGSKARVVKKTRNHGDLLYKCNLRCGMQTEDDGVYYLSTKPTMMSSSYPLSDVLEDVEYANAPIIEPNSDVAIYVYSKTANFGFVLIVEAGKIDPSYSTATVFKHKEELA